MRTSLILCLLFFAFSFLNAQTYFYYDNSGHRINRVIVLSSPAQAPPPSQENDENDPVLQDEENLAFIEDDDDSSPMFSPEIPDNNIVPEKFYTDRLNQSDVIIYPNPTKGALAVEIRNKNSQISHHLTVFNLNGSAIFQKNNINHYTEIDLSSQPKGVYLLRISSQEKFVTWRIIKE
jgi:hypothetical protein